MFKIKKSNKTVLKLEAEYSGEVRFIYNGKVKEGTIFGKSFYQTNILFGKKMYYVIDKQEKVYEIGEHAIQKK